MNVQRLKLRKLNNTRDLGGIPAADGRTIAFGKLFRSGRLSHLPKATKKALEEKNIRTVVDLRTDTERAEHPDTKLAGADYIALPLLCAPTGGITAERSSRLFYKAEGQRIKEHFGTADNYMVAMYKMVLFSDEPVKLLKDCLRLIIDNDGCVLWHCSGGKDRAGLVAMLVESLLGVDEKMIVEDYVASHRFQHRRFFWNKFGLMIAPLVPRFKKILFGMMAAKPRYILDTMNEVKAQYGSVVNYCRQRLGITDEDIAKMREKYLEPAKKGNIFIG